ncbi:MAG: DUF2357 domain-containing protein [Mollicutes bacterium]|nr:DUF2357 domain-containing protein [Mollicutes bacterium]
MPTFYDRFSQKWIDEGKLPRDIDLGRFVNESSLELTNRTYSCGSDHYIHQELLDDRNVSLHNIFSEIQHKIQTDKNGVFDVSPTVQSVSSQLSMYEFEEYLYEKVQHIEQICRQPHFLLQRTIEKVNVARAKRLPNKSYQHLASHTEDWQQKSIIQFKPSRVLNEELDVNYNVYENQLTLALINRCLKYLDGRLRGLKDLKKVLSKYDDLNRLLSGKDIENAWYEKVHRNFSLIGGSMTDYQEKFLETVSKTEESLTSVYRTLLRCKSSSLFNEVDSRMTANITLHDTNVLVNHKHYRYVRALWIEFSKFNPDKGDEEQKDNEQNIIEGLRSYVKVLFAYTILNMSYVSSNYLLDGTYNAWDGFHDKKVPLSFMENEDKSFTLEIGDYSLRFVVLGNSSLSLSSLPARTFAIYYSPLEDPGNDKAIRVDPYDVDSSERLGKVLNKYILVEYAKNIMKEYEFPQHLRDFVKFIEAPWISFNSKRYSYSFVEPGEELNKKSCISSELVVGKNIRDDQKKDLIRLVEDINKNYSEAVESNFYCFHCLSPLNLHLVEKLNYLQCQEDDFTLDLSQPGIIILKNNDEKYSGLNIDWGLDCLEVEIDKL